MPRPVFREDSICRSPEDELFDLVDGGSAEELRKFLERRDEDARKRLLSHVHPDRDRTALYHAIASAKGAALVETLLEHGSDPELSQAIDGHKRAIHLAAEAGDVDTLRTVIKWVKRLGGDVNVAAGSGNTALLAAIKDGDDVDKMAACVEALLKAGADPDKASNRNMSPVLWAAIEKYRDVVEVLVATPGGLDLDTHRDIRGSSARDHIAANWPELLDNLTGNAKAPKQSDLFECLHRNQQEAFVTIDQSVANASDGIRTLLQAACEQNRAHCVRHLLDAGADPNLATDKTKDTPLAIAARNGHVGIFEALLQDPRTELDGVVLGEVLKRVSSAKMSHVDHQACYEAFMRAADGRGAGVELDRADWTGRTPLHHAVRYGKSAHVLELLARGASLAKCDCNGYLAVDGIEAGVLRRHLDNCVKVSRRDDHELAVTFDYSSLVTTSKPRKSKASEDLEMQSPMLASSATPEEAAKETDVVAYISEKQELRPLLCHPLLASFLYLKWQRVRWLFRANAAFYTVFCASLVAYVFLGPRQDAWALTLRTTLAASFVVLVLRELLQLAIAPTSHLKDFENWIEAALLACTAWLLSAADPASATFRQTAAVAMVIAAFELVMLFGQHPSHSTHVAMFRAVSCKFVSFLAWYSVLILAFALSFHVLFGDGGGFFAQPGGAIFKTVVMVTGEFEAGDMDFQVSPYTSHLIFMLFVLTIAVILYNLLNGLAVSDTTLIQANAEVVGHVSCVRYIAKVEQIATANVLPSRLMSAIARWCCCLGGKFGLGRFGFPSQWTLLREPFLTIHPYKRPWTSGKPLDKKTVEATLAWLSRETSDGDVALNQTLAEALAKQQQALDAISKELQARRRQLAEIEANQKSMADKMEAFCSASTNNNVAR